MLFRRKGKINFYSSQDLLPYVSETFRLHVLVQETQKPLVIHTFALITTIAVIPVFTLN